MKGYEALAEMYLSARILSDMPVTEEHREKAYRIFKKLLAVESEASGSAEREETRPLSRESVSPPLGPGFDPDDSADVTFADPAWIVGYRMGWQARGISDANPSSPDWKYLARNLAEAVVGDFEPRIAEFVRAIEVALAADGPVAERCATTVTSQGDERVLVHCELPAGHEGRHEAEDRKYVWEGIDLKVSAAEGRAVTGPVKAPPSSGRGDKPPRSADDAPEDDFIERVTTAAEDHYGIAMCEHGIPIRVNADRSMVTVCIECSERIKAEGYDKPAAVDVEDDTSYRLTVKGRAVQAIKHQLRKDDLTTDDGTWVAAAIEDVAETAAHALGPYLSADSAAADSETLLSDAREWFRTEDEARAYVKGYRDAEEKR